MTTQGRPTALDDELTTSRGVILDALTGHWLGDTSRRQRGGQFIGSVWCACGWRAESEPGADARESQVIALRMWADHVLRQIEDVAGYVRGKP